MAELPWVMLGLRATSNLDTGVSPSILVTGQPLTLPGQLVLQRAEIDDASIYGRQLASAMAALRFTQNPWHGKKNVRAKVPQALWTVKRVLLRSDKVSLTAVGAEIHRSISRSPPLGQSVPSAA